jgi:hypothetical protein
MTFQNQNWMPQMRITPSFVQLEERDTLPTTAMLLHKEGKSRNKRAFVLHMLVMELLMLKATEPCLTVKSVRRMLTKKHFEPSTPRTLRSGFLL